MHSTGESPTPALVYYPSVLSPPVSRPIVPSDDSVSIIARLAEALPNFFLPYAHDGWSFGWDQDSPPPIDQAVQSSNSVLLSDLASLPGSSTSDDLPLVSDADPADL